MSEHCRYPSIAIASVPGCQLNDPSDKLFLFRADIYHLSLGSPVLLENPADPSLRDRECPTGTYHRLSSPGRAYEFPREASSRISMPGARTWHNIWLMPLALDR